MVEGAAVVEADRRRQRRRPRRRQRRRRLLPRAKGGDRARQRAQPLLRTGGLLLLPPPPQLTLLPAPMVAAVVVPRQPRSRARPKGETPRGGGETRTLQRAGERSRRAGVGEARLQLPQRLLPRQGEEEEGLLLLGALPAGAEGEEEKITVAGGSLRATATIREAGGKLRATETIREAGILKPRKSPGQEAAKGPQEWGLTVVGADGEGVAARLEGGPELLPLLRRGPRRRLPAAEGGGALPAAGVRRGEGVAAAALVAVAAGALLRKRRGPQVGRVAED